MKKEQKLALTGVMVVGLLMTSTTGLSLVLSNIAGAFPNASAASVQMVYTLAAGAGLIGSILAGFLAGKLSNKKMLMLFMALMSASGILGYLGYTSMALLYMASLILGIAIGGSDPISTALIVEFFEEDSRARWIGMKSVAVSVGGLVTTFLAGMLASGGWNHVYFVYLLGIPALILILVFVPNHSSIEVKQITQAETGNGKLLNNKVLKLMMMNVIVAITWVVYNNNISFLIGGDASKSSYVTMVFMAGMLLCGFFIDFFRRTLKKYGIPCFMALMSASLWIFTQSGGNIVLLCIGAGLIGVGFCAYTALSMTWIPEIASPGKTTQTMTCFSAITTAGQLIHPYVITVPALWIGESPMIRFYICAVILTLGTIYAFIVQKGAE